MRELLDFLHQAGKLKDAYRFSEGPKILQDDSSADHSWRLSLMSFLVADELKLDINVEHAMKLAIIHDLAESLTGDIDARLVFEGKVSPEEKHENETKAIHDMVKNLPKQHQILELWNEYEDAKTNEAKYIKALDKLETWMHLIEKKVVDHPDMIATYTDKSIAAYPELLPLQKELKHKLKDIYSELGIPWTYS